MRLVDRSKVSENALKNFDRPHQLPNAKRASMAIAKTSKETFFKFLSELTFTSTLDKRDTINGWHSGADSSGVPYAALLYQRYVGGEVRDAYSDKGDALLEYPLRDWHSASPHQDPTGAEETMQPASHHFVVPDR